ncbi:MAG: glycosyltransferase [Scytonema sp. PMC 1069.18]|nr:glycosyltransferase [Scytonema sp. PMC 1069.18]MEC4883132.1 glycosyltransferase [Scytonema sp. PMC 1070.18]
MYINTSKRIVVLHIITGLSTGGAERMLYSLLSKINRLRFQPVVISLIDRGSYGDRIEALSIPVYTINMRQGIPPTPDVIWRLARLVHQIKPDLIQGWMYHGNLAAQLAHLFLKKQSTSLWSIHHSISSLKNEKKMTSAIIKWCAYLSQLPSKIIFVSKTSKLQHEALGYCSKNNHILPNGFDTSLFTPSVETRLSVREELHLPKDSLLIGLFGRYHPMKDHANFIQAAALLLKDYPDIHFLLAGTDINQDNQSLYQLIQDLGVFHQMHLLGERNDMARLTAALDVATSSSAYGEAFPMVIGEAMSCGVPCVVTDVGDSPWIVGNTGRVVPPKQPEALASAWKELIVLGSDGRHTLGQAARNRILQSFSLEKVVAQYENLYETALAHV